MIGRELLAPLEPEAALLPGPFQVLDSTPVTLPWGVGRQVTLALFGAQPVDPHARAPVIAVERHVLVLTTRSGRFAYDFVARARIAAELQSVGDVLDRLVASSQLLP